MRNKQLGHPGSELWKPPVGSPCEHIAVDVLPGIIETAMRIPIRRCGEINE